jgi:hypothetical protein
MDIDLKIINLCADDILYIFDELKNDNSSFYHTRGSLIIAYKQNNIYGLLEKNILQPCYCIVQKSEVSLDGNEPKQNIIINSLWVKSTHRLKGFGKTLVKLVKAEYCFDPQPETLNFWKKCGIKSEEDELEYIIDNTPYLIRSSIKGEYVFLNKNYEVIGDLDCVVDYNELTYSIKNYLFEPYKKPWATKLNYQIYRNNFDKIKTEQKLTTCKNPKVLFLKDKI